MMFLNKCLWTFITTTLVTILEKHQCMCATFAVETNGDELYTDRPEEKHSPVWENFPNWKSRNENSQDLSIAQLNTDKRKWSKFTSWGKRAETLGVDSDWNGQEVPGEKRKIELLEEPLNVDEQVWPKLSNWNAAGALETSMTAEDWSGTDKRDWSRFTSWGKRDGEGFVGDADKRKWSKFTSWGKRDQTSLDALEKRKWAKFTSWGKREDPEYFNNADKRKWAKFTSWGKRSDDEIDAEKRKWAKFTSWGKRDGDFETDNFVDYPDKRKWTRLAVWGKRSVDETATADKRDWSKFASWGKRPRNPQAWLALNTWGKRRWTGLPTWGKRSSLTFSAETVARKILQLFDANEDGALDLEELTAYIKTLMSLPSKQEAEVVSREEETQ